MSLGNINVLKEIAMQKKLDNENLSSLSDNTSTKKNEDIKSIDNESLSCKAPIGKTIKQIADEIGVSKQAVHQKRKSKLLSTSLQPFTSTVDGIVYITVDGEKLIKQAFNPLDCKTVDDNNSSTVDSTVYSVLSKTIDTLHNELEQNNELINKLQQQLFEERQHSRELADKLVIITDQSQKLQLAQMQEMKLIGESKKKKTLFFWK